jgi:hypothetical protein
MDTTTIIIISVILCCICICSSISGYFLTLPSETSTSNVTNSTSSDTPLPAPLPAPLPVPSPAPIPAPIQQTWNYSIGGTGLWDNNAANEYTCPNVPSVNSTYKTQYCIVSSEQDAINYCNSESTCAGYVTNSPTTYQLLNKQPVKNEAANGTYYQKYKTSYLQPYRGSGTMSGPWIEKGEKFLPIQLTTNINGITYYIIQDKEFVKFASATSGATPKYYVGTISQFDPSKWNTYSDVPVGNYIVNNP